MIIYKLKNCVEEWTFISGKPGHQEPRMIRNACSEHSGITSLRHHWLIDVEDLMGWDAYLSSSCSRWQTMALSWETNASALTAPQN